MDKKLLPILITITYLLLINNYSIAQQKTITYYEDPASHYENKVIKLNHLEAWISPDTLTGTVRGRAIFDFSPLRPDFDSIVMYAPGILPELVTINGKSIVFNKIGNNLILKRLPGPWPENNNQLEISYNTTGPHEPYFVGWDDKSGRMRRQVWAHRPFGWIPFQNDRITVDLHINFSSKYQVYSNGVRISVTENEDGNKSWHYRMNKPHPFFSTALVIGKYEFKEMKTTSGVPLEYWFYPDLADHFDPTYRYSIEMFDFLEKELGIPYPWELYRQAPVADYLYGAMETTTATIFGDYMQIGERGWWGRNYVNVNVHELTHQWFGNYIAHEPGSDVWLTESMATYYAKLFEKSIFGNDYYEKERLSEQSKSLTQAEKDNYPLSHSRAGSFRWYQKGSLVLEMLRDEMGDSLFRKAMTHYLTKFAFKEASSHDFIRSFYETTGLPLHWFFRQWLFQGGEPHFEVSYNSGINLNYTELRIKQIQPITQTEGLFRVTANITAGYSDGSISDHRITITGQDSTFRISNPRGLPVEFIIFDSGNRLLKRLTFSRNLSQLKAAALKAPKPIDKYEALTALRKFGLSDKRDALLQCAGLSENELIYAEVLSQLSTDTSNSSRVFFHGALKHPDALIRRAALSYYNPQSPADTSKFVHLLFDPDFINTELCLRKLCTFMPDNADYWLSVTSGEYGWRGLNIRMAWLEIAVNRGDTSRLPELKDYASPSFEFETRINAIKALQKLDYIDIDHAINLVKACRHWNPKLSGPATEALNVYYKQPENESLIDKALMNEHTDKKEAGISVSKK